MGGGAFMQASAQGEPTLNTPRMSPGEYRTLKQHYLTKLQQYFPTGKVVCLTEAPEKTDYGDIDIFVAVDKRVNFIDVANYLGATGVIYHSSKKAQKCTMAVPKDLVPSSRPVVEYKHIDMNNDRKPEVSSAPVSREEYAQIDVEIVHPELLEWYTFYSSYGDLVGLLGRIVKNLWFTTSDRGFWLRMKELDYSKTVDDPKQVMSFLGLSVEKYDAGFRTLDEMYAWIGACRLLSVEAIKVKRDNASERYKEKKRTIFTKFFKEWLPAHMDMDLAEDEEEWNAKLQQLRQMHLEEAIDFFSIREEYNVKHNAIVLQMNNAMAASLLKPFITQHSGRADKQLTEIMRAFRRYVGVDASGNPYVLRRPHADVESQLHLLLGEDFESLADPKGTSEWVKEHWEELRSLERQRVKA
ncbi:hypothetical protein LTR37_012007 [Vermiconidia calcicola]|uniref:Uncharacterized protein n=1 Tax=Vermiconidia calcicola TaxID=1690605 RepID=A0ACC3N186_9PEZI|nr:hypothetical protein LTR37_012007 [Vermiconidia calcicola]